MSASTKKDPGSNRPTKKQKIKAKKVQSGSHEEVLLVDVKEILRIKSPLEGCKGAAGTGSQDGPWTVDPAPQLPEKWHEIELDIDKLSSTGDGLAYDSSSGHVFVVPFSLPGDRVVAKVVQHFPAERYTNTDFVRVLKPSAQRDDALVRCQYFGACSGCQFQMLDYKKQLEHKKEVVEKAYLNFSDLDPKVVPGVEETFASPLQYGYRTKLTPHFSAPRSWSKPGPAGTKAAARDVPPIGYTRKGSRQMLDIEDCPIGTEPLRIGLKRERQRVAREIDQYKRGATILLRESTEKVFQSSSDRENISSSGDAQTDAVPSMSGTVRQEGQEGVEYVLKKSCITDHKAIATEYIGPFTFQNTANSFFQNNNSILEDFTNYVRSHALLPTPESVPPSAAANVTERESSLAPQSDLQQNHEEANQIKYLVDAYCGSGLFSVTLSSVFKASIGVDIDQRSIEAAATNVRLNKIEGTKFQAADAPHIFASIEFPPDETVIIIDPPRKGCDESFLGQLLAYGPKRIVYVSCNVHTQARDVGVLVRGMTEDQLQVYRQDSYGRPTAAVSTSSKSADREVKHDAAAATTENDPDHTPSADAGGHMPTGQKPEGQEPIPDTGARTSYTIESIKPFDFFPQTAHVEGVAVLNRRA
ncbi:MAG: tRNA(m5U54)methyltransferase [Lichina confinis]|nr:MAG: tRNA(m5U54)methyltransferase [Lichina confinis]